MKKIKFHWRHQIRLNKYIHTTSKALSIKFIHSGLVSADVRKTLWMNKSKNDLQMRWKIYQYSITPAIDSLKPDLLYSKLVFKNSPIRYFLTIEAVRKKSRKFYWKLQSWEARSDFNENWVWRKFAQNPFIYASALKFKTFRQRSYWNAKNLMRWEKQLPSFLLMPTNMVDLMKAN